MDRLEWKNTLKRHPIFSVLTKDEIEKLLNVSTPREYNSGQAIIQAREDSQSAYLVGAGEVNVMLPWKGGEEVPVSTLRKDDFFGEMAAIEAKPRAATVRAVTPCSLLEIPRDDFLNLLNEHSDIELKVAASLSSRLRRIGEEVLRRQIELHHDIKSLDGRLNAELKAMDATLKASQAMFDQTNKRANEVIENAERGRTRATWVVSTITGIFGVVVLLLGLFGWKEVTDISNRANDFDKLLDQATIKVTEAETISERVRDLITEEQVTRFIGAQGLAEETAWRAAQYVFLPEFRKALEDQRIFNAVHLYDTITKLSPDDPPSAQFLLEIEDRFIKDWERDAVGDVLGQDYESLLKRVLKDATRLEDKIHCYYLLLTNAILRQAKAEVYEGFSSGLERVIRDYRKENKEQRMPPIREEFVALINEKNKANQQVKTKLCRVFMLIPLDSQTRQNLVCS